MGFHGFQVKVRDFNIIINTGGVFILFCFLFLQGFLNTICFGAVSKRWYGKGQVRGTADEYYKGFGLFKKEP